MTKAAIPNPTGHPARYSGAIVDRLRTALLDRHPDPDSRPYVFDPFAGTGERLAEILNDRFEGGGIELYGDFIVDRKLVKVGDATKPDGYPTNRPFIIVTSPVYPNGMAEAWKVSEADTSKRNTYSANRKSKTKPNDMGVLGYRGTKRGGRSVKRQAYWNLASDAAYRWTDNPLCTEVYLNVSDFMSGGEVEPFVQDWRDLLKRNGWKIVTTYRVRTPRHNGNDNADQRVGHECIIVAQRT